MESCGDVIALERGHYRLIECIGGSAYGAVWRAACQSGARDVALKLVNEAQMAQAGPGLRQRWVASAQAEIDFLESLAPWDGRHIVRLLDCGAHQGLPVLALELMSCDLGRHVRALRLGGAAPPLGTVLAWMAQLNQALGKVHQYGWRHLDLKPGNVLVDTRRGLVKLADFGANRRLAAAGEHSYTGTAAWQAPEQFFPARGGGYVTGAASDYFALGCLFYFMVTGGVALQFGGACGQARRDEPHAAAATLLARHGGKAPPTLLPEEMEAFAGACGRAALPALALLLRLLDPDPAGRPRHALEISRALAAACAAAGVEGASQRRTVGVAAGAASAVGARHAGGPGAAQSAAMAHEAAPHGPATAAENHPGVASAVADAAPRAGRRGGGPWPPAGRAPLHVAAGPGGGQP